jgi:hypothetical protein
MKAIEEGISSSGIGWRGASHTEVLPPMEPSLMDDQERMYVQRQMKADDRAKQRASPAGRGRGGGGPHSE